MHMIHYNLIQFFLSLQKVGCVWWMEFYSDTCGHGQLCYTRWCQ